MNRVRQIRTWQPSWRKSTKTDMGVSSGKSPHNKPLEQNLGDAARATGRGRRTYPPGPLTLGVRLRSGCDNRGNFIPHGGGDNGSRKKTEKAGGRPPRAHMDRISKHF